MSRIEERNKRPPEPLKKFTELFDEPAIKDVPTTKQPAYDAPPAKTVSEAPAIKKQSSNATTPKKISTDSPISKKTSTDAITSTIHFTPKKETKKLVRTVLLRPSVYKAATEKCTNLGMSFNELINQFLENFVDEQQ